MQRTIIIGDVHGCFEELLDLLDRVGATSDDRLLSVGDLVDRGPRSVEVVAHFRGLPSALVLMGNHERKHVRNVFSYGQEITRLQFGTEYDDARAWMQTLPYYFEDEHVRVVHAAMIPGVPLAEQREEILCGSTKGENEIERLLGGRRWHELYSDAKPIVFGHHVVGKDPFVRDDLVFGIDTGACHGLSLTALTVPDFKLYSVPARSDHWARVKREWQIPVLESKPWTSMPWSTIAERLADFERTDDGAVRAYVAALRDWSRELEAKQPTLLSAAEALGRETLLAHGEDGFGRAARAHAASSLLFAWRAERLTLATIQGRASTPARLVELAAILGVPIHQPLPAR